MPTTHRCEQLIALFNETFFEPYNTRLVGGGDEPEYIPADGELFTYHRIIFTQDYFSSALHEIAHWCIAGEKRRQQQDYGYWYAPDGRSIEQQKIFESVEVKPQAIEWLFSQACGICFRVSADNLLLGNGASDTFKKDIVRQSHHYCLNGVSDRVGAFLQALSSYYHTKHSLESSQYTLELLS